MPISRTLCSLWLCLANLALLFSPFATQDTSVHDIFVKALSGAEVVLPCDCGMAGKLQPSDPPLTPFHVHWFRHRGSKRTPIVSRWTNGTQQIFGDWKNSEVGVNGSSLRINRLNYPRDHGKFACSIENDVAVIVNVLAPVTVVSIIGAKIVDDETMLDVSAGEHNLATCRTYANPVPVFRWRLGTRQIDGGRIVATDDPHTGSLRFFVTKDMHGRILKCRAKNALTNFTETAVKLNVLYKPVVTSVYKEPSRDLVEGDSLTLRCKADGNPTPSFSWRRGMTGSATVVSNSDSYHIAAVELTQAGRYRCLATNAEGSSSKFVSVSIDPPKFSVSYDDNTKTLECITEVRPSDMTFGPWEQHIGDRIIPRKPVHLTRSENLIRLFPLTYEDTGLYLCTATSGLKKIRSSSYYVKPDTKPVFQLEQQTSYSVKLGSTLNIRVLYYVHPNRTSVRWVMLNKDHSTYVTDRIRTEKQEPADLTLSFHGVEVTVRGTAAILNLASIEPSDEGNYSLIVINSMGKSTFRFSVSLRSFDTKSSPSIQFGPAAVVGTVVGASLVVMLIVVLVLVKCELLPCACGPKSRYRYSPPIEGTHVDIKEQQGGEPAVLLGTFQEFSSKEPDPRSQKDDVNRNIQM